MEKLFIILLTLIFIGAFIVAVVEGIFKALCQLIVGLFSGAGIYGIITVVCVVIFIVAVIYIIKS